MKRSSVAAALSAAALVCAVAAAAGCGGGDRPGADDASPAVQAPAVVPSASPAGEAAPSPAPAPPDPLAQAEDSMREADLFRQRQQSMETYESCMRKAQGLEPHVRATIVAACKRSRGAPRP
ncbi:MAG TPA: hypothetical protein VFJ82_00940 [Longimicrobium sp.]|nr:hypothetical protein [Longimicrobium sp.]